MLTKKSKIKLVVFFIVFVSLFLLSGNFLLINTLGNVPLEKSLSFDQSLNLRQGLNQCGPMSVMCTVNSLTGEKYDYSIFEKNMKYRFSNNMTFPFGLISLLKEYDIDTEQKILIFYSDDHREKFLKKMINENKPVIILNRTDGYLHYFTILGYDRKGFHIYDSYQELDQTRPGRYTLDKNGVNPGNRFYTNKELMEMWRLGGKYGFHSYAIVADKS